MIKKFLLVCASLGALVAQSSAFAQNAKSDYRAIVGVTNATTNFKSIQIPANITTINGAGTARYKIINYETTDIAPEKMKIFLPPGTIGFSSSLYLFVAQEEGKAALRLHEPPITPLNSIRPENVYTTKNLGGPTGVAYDVTILNNLVNREEVLYYSEGGGANYMLLSAGQTRSEPLTTGGYIYANFQYPGGRSQQSSWRIYVEANCYEQWFNSSTDQWDVNGNPKEDATHTCAGSTGGTETPSPISVELDNINLSHTWNAATGKGNTIVTVQPKPVDAALSVCTSSDTRLLAGPTASATGIQFEIQKDAVLARTQDTSVEVNCNGKKAILNLRSVSTVATVVEPNAVKPIKGVDGKYSKLLVTLKHTDAEVAEKTQITYWVGTLLPKYPSFSQNDDWYFLSTTSTSSVSPVSYQWKVFTGSPFEFETVAFTKNSIEAEKLLSIPLGYDASEFKALNAKIYIGYRQGNGIFKNLGVVWDASGY